MSSDDDELLKAKLGASTSGRMPTDGEWAHMAYLLGPLKALFDNPLVSNIESNEDDIVFYEEFGKPKQELSVAFTAPQREALIGYLANQQAGVRPVTLLNARLSCDMEPFYDARITAFAPPISWWPLVIRIHNLKLFTLDDYLNAGDLNPAHRAFLRNAVGTYRSILIAGAPDAGKNTFENAVNDEISVVCPQDRLVILQDRKEVKAPSRNKMFINVRVEQAHANGDRFLYDFAEGLEDALRSNAVRLIVQEVRDGLAVMVFIMALNVGAKGTVSTLHCDSVEDACDRIEDMLRSKNLTPVPRMIARFVDVIVFMRKDPMTGRRSVVEIGEVKGVDANGKYIIQRVAA